MRVHYGSVLLLIHLDADALIPCARYFFIVRQLVLVVARCRSSERSRHSVVEEDVRRIVSSRHESVRREMIARVVEGRVQCVDNILRFFGKTRVMFRKHQTQRNVLGFVPAASNIFESECQQVRQHPDDMFRFALGTRAFWSIDAADGCIQKEQVSRLLEYFT